MASTWRRRRLAGIAAAALFASCSHRLPNGGEWASELAVRPGSSLPREGVSLHQVIFTRQLAVLRLDTLSGCKLVPRR
jgi:hypothetical protein